MNTNKKGEDTGGTNNSMCSASASADTVIHESTVCVQSGLKYNNLCDKCLERIHYNILHWVVRWRNFFQVRSCAEKMGHVSKTTPLLVLICHPFGKT